MTTFERLSCLAGRWEGRGRGQYPTIEPFEFVEETTFLMAPEYPMVRYEQRAWLLPDREASHWELGLWRIVEDDQVEVSNAQDSGRVEVLRGRIDDGRDFALTLVNTCIANDARLIRTERQITVRSDVLHYVKFMTTATTPEPKRLQHLEATLKRMD